MNEVLLEQFRLYPESQLQDFLKLVYQNEFGCGHLLNDTARSFSVLKNEYHTINKEDFSDPVENIGEEFARVHLRVLQQTGLTIETLHRIFALSAQKETGSQESFLKKVEIVRNLCAMGKLPFSVEEVEARINEWKNKPLVPFRHSEHFRQTYHPAYRVIEKKYADILPLLAQIDTLMQNQKSVVLSIDGDCGSGKSTLAEVLRQIYDCSIIRIDDFFLRKEQRTPERVAEIGGNIDYERFSDEVLSQLRMQNSFAYRPYNCMVQKLDEPILIASKRLMIVEGSYSQHPLFDGFYDLKVFLSIPSKIQHARILERNGAQMYEKFEKIWIPMEKRYFEHFQIREKSDLQFEFLSGTEENSLK